MMSLKARQEGNEFFRSSKEPGIGCTIQKFRLEQAMKCYNKAINLAVNKDERASAYKNCAVVTNKIAELAETNSSEQALWAHQEAVSFSTKALEHGAGSKNSEWMASMEISADEFTEQALTYITYSLVAEGDKPYYKALMNMGENAYSMHMKAKCYQSLGNKYLALGVEAAGSGDFKMGQQMLAESYRPLELAQAAAGKISNREEKRAMMSEINTLRQDVQYTTCLTQSTQARTTGDELMKKCLELKGQGETNHSMYWETADWYRHAIISTRDLDIEAEAIAQSHLGVLYDKLFGLKAYSKPCFRRCVELALTMMPRDLTSSDWYKNAEEALKRYQAELNQNDADAEEEERKKYLDELKDEIEKLKALTSEGDIKMIIGIYKEFPPKNKQHKLKETDPAKLEDKVILKKMYRNAAVHYHPDSQIQHGKKWKVLAGEISKMINATYERFKGVDVL